MTAVVALMRWGGKEAWPLDALRLGVVMALFALVSSEAVRVVYSPGPTATAVEVVRTWTPAVMVAFAVVVGPVVETALLAALHWLLRVRVGLALPVWAWVSAALFALAHIGTNRVPLPQFLGFLLMSYQYALVRDGRGASIAYAAVALSHTTYNAASITALLAIFMLG